MSLMQNVSGIYKVTCTATGIFYIGSAKNIKTRWRRHRSQLRVGKHKNRRLQTAWDRWGECRFVIEVIEEVAPETNKLIDREQYYLDTTHCCDRSIGFNICKTARAPYQGPARTYFVTSPTGETNVVTNLSKFALENNLALNRMYLGGCCGWRCKPTDKNRAGRRPSKRYYVESPGGKTELIDNLNEYCRENDLINSHMVLVARGVSPQHKGYLCRMETQSKQEWEAARGRRKCGEKWEIQSPLGDVCRVSNLKAYCKIEQVNYRLLVKNRLPGWAVRRLVQNNKRPYMVKHPDGTIEQINDLPSFARNRQLSVASLQKVASGEQRQTQGFECWSAETCREDWLKTIPKLKGSARRHPTKWIVTSPCGRETLVDSMRAFCIATGLSCVIMGRVAAGRQRNHKGWSARPEFMTKDQWEQLCDTKQKLKTSKRVYTFVSESGLVICDSNLRSIARKANIPRRAASKIARGILSSYNGWELLQVSG